MRGRNSCDLTRAGLVALTWLTLAACEPVPEKPVDPVDQEAGHLPAACADLTGITLDDTRITAAELIPSGSFSPSAGGPVFEVKPFCRVTAQTNPAVNFEVWLPVGNWNGKFQGVGNGGMAGSISYAAMTRALSQGYATASTDTGHQAGDIPYDASWALERPTPTMLAARRAASRA